MVHVEARTILRKKPARKWADKNKPNEGQVGAAKQQSKSRKGARLRRDNGREPKTADQGLKDRGTKKEAGNSASRKQSGDQRKGTRIPGKQNRAHRQEIWNERHRTRDERKDKYREAEKADGSQARTPKDHTRNREKGRGIQWWRQGHPEVQQAPGMDHPGQAGKPSRKNNKEGRDNDQAERRRAKKARGGGGKRGSAERQ